jgi:VanZ family protein
MPESTSIIASRLRRVAQYARYASLLLLLAMFIGTHIPSSISPDISVSDKAIHATAFMTLTISLLLSWELSRGTLQPQHYFAVWLFCTLYGIFDEITQTPFGRTCDGLDWMADIVGIIVGLTLYRSIRPIVLRWL